MTDIRKDFEELYARDYFSLADWQSKPEEEATLKAYMLDAYQAGCAHDVDGLIAEIEKERDSLSYVGDEPWEVAFDRIISIIRKHFGKE